MTFFFRPPAWRLGQVILFAAILGFLISVTGCNTMQGLGKDIEKAGEAIQKSTK